MLTQERWHACRLGNFRLSEGGEVQLYIALRTIESLLLARPEGNPDRPLRLHSQRLQDAHRFHRDDRACSVVGGAGAGDPAIQVAADHYYLVLQLRIVAGN